MIRKLDTFIAIMSKLRGFPFWLRTLTGSEVSVSRSGSGGGSLHWATFWGLKPENKILRVTQENLRKCSHLQLRKTGKEDRTG